MRSTDVAMKDFNTAMTNAANAKSLTDIAEVLGGMCGGCWTIALAIQETYDKLRQIDQKLSSASTYKTPTM